MLPRIARWLRSPSINAFTGLLIAATGVADVLSPFLDDVSGNEATVGAQHGVTLLGIVMMLRSLGDLVGGVKEVGEGLAVVRESRVQNGASVNPASPREGAPGLRTSPDPEPGP